MIPRAHITAWRAEAPWATDAQVEQDLVISRALVEIFSDALLADALAFRGGTALHKLFFRPPARYSEDIDLVQVRAEKIGPVLEALRARLDPWLRKPTWKQSEGRIALVYRFDSTSPVRSRFMRTSTGTKWSDVSRRTWGMVEPHARALSSRRTWRKKRPTSGS